MLALCALHTAGRGASQRPLYTLTSSRGNVTLSFSPDDQYILSSVSENKEGVSPVTVDTLYYCGQGQLQSAASHACDTASSSQATCCACDAVHTCHPAASHQRISISNPASRRCRLWTTRCAATSRPMGGSRPGWTYRRRGAAITTRGRISATVRLDCVRCALL